MGEESLAVPHELETERLHLRSARAGDGPALRAALDDSFDEHYPWLSFSGKRWDVEALEGISAEGARAFAADEFYVWRAWDRAGAGMVGTVDLHSLDASVPKCEVGYWVRTGWTGRGLAQEAVGAVLRVAREVLGAVRVEARCDTRNERSARVVLALGFRLEGVARRDDRDAAGDLCDTSVFAWTKDFARTPGDVLGAGA